MTKSELRKIFKEKRMAITHHEMDKFNDLILINFQKIELPFIHCLHTYLASLHLGEADTAIIVRYLQFKNPHMKVAVPKVDFHTQRLHHFHFDETVELVSNQYGIEEPAGGNKIEEEEIELVLVPLLAFDRNGYRVGYGKGYYDQFLAQCSKDVIKVGLSFFDPVEEIDDVNHYDIALNYCVTPHKLFVF